MGIKVFLKNVKAIIKQKSLDKKFNLVKQNEFYIEWLSKMSFGSGEGERDKKLNNESFIETQSIKKITEGEFNYVLAPKGCGKSALFKAYIDRFIGNNILKDDRQTIVIPISNMFAYEKMNIQQSQFAKNWAIIWGVYIIKEIFKVLTSNKYKYDFDKYLHESNKYNELKEEFELYDLWDYIENINIGLKFTIKGQEIAISPSIKGNKVAKKIILNDIFTELQQFLQENNKSIYILIDRVDDFVLGESKEDKKAFIQGIYYGIEEISNCSNIFPILFLRTDLYYNLSIDSGIDKIQIRTIELKWKREELILFIFKRLFCSSLKFRQNTTKLMEFYFLDSNNEALQKAEIMNINKLVDGKPSLFAQVANKFVYSFFPNRVKHINSQNKEEEMDFFDWVYRHFEDFTGYVNLRYLIAFFNKLFEIQCDVYEKSIDITSIKCVVHERKLYYPIFSNSSINIAYHDVQKIALTNIKSLLDTVNQKNCFDRICKVMKKRGNMNYGDIQYVKCGLTKEEYETLLDSLCVLGYLKGEGKRYSIPVLYRYIGKDI